MLEFAGRAALQRPSPAEEKRDVCAHSRSSHRKERPIRLVSSRFVLLPFASFRSLCASHAKKKSSPPVATWHHLHLRLSPPPPGAKFPHLANATSHPPCPSPFPREQPGLFIPVFSVSVVFSVADAPSFFCGVAKGALDFSHRYQGFHVAR